MNATRLLLQGDLVGISVAWTLLLMSVASWTVMAWKTWLLQRGAASAQRAVAAFWQAPNWERALQTVPMFDRENLVMPLVLAAQVDVRGTLAGSVQHAQQLTRALREALHGVLARLQRGQVLLATVASTAPFVGLLGTVWGIYHALVGLTGQAQIGLEQVSGPVGEALVMTAAGLMVAIPAVLGYNVLGRALGRIEADLEGFAFDLRALLSEPCATESRSL